MCQDDYEYWSQDYSSDERGKLLLLVPNDSSTAAPHSVPHEQQDSQQQEEVGKPPGWLTPAAFPRGAEHGLSSICSRLAAG